MKKFICTMLLVITITTLQMADVQAYNKTPGTTTIYTSGAIKYTETDKQLIDAGYAPRSSCLMRAGVHYYLPDKAVQKLTTGATFYGDASGFLGLAAKSPVGIGIGIYLFSCKYAINMANIEGGNKGVTLYQS